MNKKLLISENIGRNNFDLLRFLLATSVILCHCYATFYGWEQFSRLEPFMKWSGGKISIGSAAVNFFFVISGFLIVRSFEYSTNFWEYLKKRILRIYPGFIVVFFFSFFVFGPIGHMKEWSLTAYYDFLEFVSAKREFANMISLQSPVESRYFHNLPQTGLNNSLWTIQYEFICYLVVPLFAFLGFIRKKWWLLIALLVSFSLLGIQSLGYIFPFKQSLTGGIIETPYYYPRFFTYFLCGSCVYLYRDIIPRSNWLALLSLLIFILAFKLQLIDILWPFSGTYLLFFLAYHQKMLFPDFAKHGDFSYGIYLYGWPLQQLVVMYLGKHLNVFSFFLLVFPIILIFAFFSWKFIESPALKLKKTKVISLKWNMF